MCEYSDHYQPGLWVGLVDQYGHSKLSSPSIIHIRLNVMRLFPIVISDTFKNGFF